MHHCNLSYGMLSFYLQLCVSMGLLAWDLSNSGTLRITESGHRFFQVLMMLKGGMWAKLLMSAGLFLHTNKYLGNKELCRSFKIWGDNHTTMASSNYLPIKSRIVWSCDDHALGSIPSIAYKRIHSSKSCRPVVLDSIFRWIRFVVSLFYWCSECRHDQATMLTAAF